VSTSDNEVGSTQQGNEGVFLDNGDKEYCSLLEKTENRARPATRKLSIQFGSGDQLWGKRDQLFPWLAHEVGTSLSFLHGLYDRSSYPQRRRNPKVSIRKLWEWYQGVGSWVQFGKGTRGSVLPRKSAHTVSWCSLEPLWGWDQCC
jgi:hypothetical protein